MSDKKIVSKESVNSKMVSIYEILQLRLKALLESLNAATKQCKSDILKRRTAILEIMLLYGIMFSMPFQIREIFELASFTQTEKDRIRSDTYTLFGLDNGIQYSDDFPNHVIVRLHNCGAKYLYQVLDLNYIE